MKSYAIELMLRFQHYCNDKMKAEFGEFRDPNAVSDEAVLEFITRSGGEEFAKGLLESSHVFQSNSLEELELKLTIRGY